VTALPSLGVFFSKFPRLRLRRPRDSPLLREGIRADALLFISPFSDGLVSFQEESCNW